MSLDTFNYNTYWNERPFAIRKRLMEREEIFSNWITPGSTVLDVAAGNSLLPSHLKKNRNCVVTAFDIAPHVVAAQQQEGVTAKVNDLTANPLVIEGNFDYIIASEILEHLALPEQVIPVLKKHAKYLIISVPNSAFYKFRLQLLRGNFIKQWNAHPSEHLRFWSHNEFIHWLKAGGLEVVETCASNGLDIGPIKLYRYFPNLFGHQMCYLCKVSE